MEKRSDGLWKAGKKPKRNRRQIDIPLDDAPSAQGDGLDFSDKELEFVNRHHEEYKEQRRRARQQGGN